jgi:transcriptional regulator with XRE-family HTH domain
MSTLRILREVNNYTQEYVAEKIGVDQSTYSKIERNPKNLRTDQAEKLAELYDVSLSDVITGGVSIAFSNNTIDKGYVHHLHEAEQSETINAHLSEIKSLKEEIEYLRNQNKQLLDLIGKK